MECEISVRPKWIDCLSKRKCISNRRLQPQHRCPTTRTSWCLVHVPATSYPAASLKWTSKWCHTRWQFERWIPLTLFRQFSFSIPPIYIKRKKNVFSEIVNAMVFVADSSLSFFNIENGWGFDRVPGHLVLGLDPWDCSRFRAFVPKPPTTIAWVPLTVPEAARLL